MIFPMESSKEWSSKYKIPIKKANCPKCNKSIITDIPFAIKGYRGLKSKDHGCGENYTRKVVVATDKDEIRYWAGIAQII